ncbi:hypothetical protein GCM10023323_39370 [Streptomyces thinghirensis]|uniref:Protein kinase domain-containing protein n=1 Tax=Streptomyces thinghirensis TaxID=551547 RepID=A0ABP9T7Q6_9ACTN
MWRAFAPTQEREGDCPSARLLLVGIARTWAEQLARLQAAGWAHADVQPTNTLITDAGRVDGFAGRRRFAHVRISVQLLIVSE